MSAEATRPTIFTAAEVAEIVTETIDLFRNPLRQDASKVDAFTAPRLRQELVAQIDLLNRVDETIRQVLGAPSRVAPARPELRDIPDPDGEDELPPPPSTHRRAHPIEARWIPDKAEGR